MQHHSSSQNTEDIMDLINTILELLASLLGGLGG